MHALMFSLLLLTGAAHALTDPRIGELDPDFNHGEALAGLATGPSIGLLASIVRQPGAFATDRRYWFSGIDTHDLVNPSTLLGAFRNADVSAIPPGFEFEQIQVQLSAAGATFGTATGPRGAMLIVSSNDRDMQGAFAPTLRVYDIGSSDTTSLVLAAQYRLTEPGEPPAESTHLLIGGADPEDPDWDDATQAAFRFYSTLFSGKSSVCFDTKVVQHTLRRAEANSTPQIEFDSVLALSGVFGQCHQKYARGVRWVDPDAGSESLIYGVRCRESETAPESACFYKLRPARLGGPLEVDKLWGGGDGQVILKTTDGSDFRYFDHVVDPHGRVIASVGIGNSTAGYKPFLAALTPTGGSLDTIFGGSGVLPIPAAGANTNPRKVTYGYDVGYQVTGETYTATSVRPFSFFYDTRDNTSKYTEYALPGRMNSTFYAHVREPNGKLTAVGTWFPNYPSAAGQQPLIVRFFGPTVATEAFQYHHRDFDHDFLTSFPDDIAKLNAGYFSGWERTGESFHIYPPGTPGTRDQYRFFGASFGDKSSHFFTHDPVEAAQVMHNPDWLYEGTVSAVRPLAVNGECPVDAAPVFRAYNNGMGDAPNHLFTSSVPTLSLKLSVGYVAEGVRPLGRIYCAEQ